MAEAATDASAGRTGHRYDLYVVHAAADAEWVQGFFLPTVGLPGDRVITADSFRLGAALVEELQRSVAESRCTVVVLTPAFLADTWSKAGAVFATHAGLAGERPSVVPLLREPCEVPLGLDVQVRLDCTEEANWEREAGRLRALLDAPEPVADEVPCPYPGMRPFAGADAPRFHGREQEIKDLAGRVRHLGLLAVIGPSGSGKSSLVLAGVLPELDRVHGATLVVRSMRPGTDPLVALADALGVAGTTGDLDAPAAAGALLAANPTAVRLVLVVDQFEEVFTLAAPAGRAAFLPALDGLRRSGRVTVLPTMRADFFGDLMASSLWPLDPAERCEVPPLRGEALARAIVAPAAGVGVHIEPALVERLVADAADEPGVLPLVQETLVLLWAERRRRLVTLAAYQSLGQGDTSGLAVALARSADGAVAELAAEDQEIARRVFLGLVQLGEGRPDTRRQRPVEALRGVDDDQERFEAVVARLVGRRLLTTGGGEGTARTADLAHEALLRSWPRLRAWIQESRAWLRLQREVEGDAQAWVGAARDEGSLYRGARLASAAAWADAHPRELTPLQREFVEASRQAQVDELAEARERAAVEAARSRRLRIALVGVVVLMLVAVGLGVQARRRGDEARAQTSLARSRQLAAQALTALGTRQDQALLLALEAMATEPSLEARDALLYTLDYLPAAAYLQAGGPPVVRVAADPTGALVATADDDGQIMLWDLATRTPVALRGEGSGDDGLGFSPDGARLASVGSDGVVRVWDVETRVASEVAPLGVGKAAGAAFLDGGRLVAVAGFGGVEVWDAASHERVAGPLGDGSYGLAASADGRLLAWAGPKEVVVWDATTRAVVRTKPVGGDRPAVALSPDGSRLAMVSGDTLAVVDPVTGREIGPSRRLGSTPVAVALGDGLAAVLDGDGGVSLFDPASGGEFDGYSLGSKLGLRTIGFTADDASVVVGGDLLVQLDVDRWAALSRVAVDPAAEPVERVDPFGGPVVLSPDGRTVAAASFRGPVTVAPVDGDSDPTVLQGTEDAAGVAFGPDGRTVVVLGPDGSVGRWDAASGQRRPGRARVGKPGRVGALSPDGALAVVAGNAPGVAEVWDVASGRRLGRPAGDQPAAGAAFSPDGRRLAVATSDEVVVWDTRGRRADGEPLEGPVPEDHESDVLGAPLAATRLAFSADGGMLAAISDEDGGGVVLYDLARRSRRPVGKAVGAATVALDGDGGRLLWVEDGLVIWDVGADAQVGPALFASSAPTSISNVTAGGRVATIEEDGGVRVWELDPQVWRDAACSMANRNLTKTEWDRYLPGRPYRRTCPDHPSGTGAPESAPATRFNR